MKLALTGATGFVGSHMLSRLKAEHHYVRALVREPGRAAALASPQVEFVRADVVSGIGLDAALDGCEAVVHLVGIIMEVGDQTFERVHHLGTRNMVEAARRAGVSRFVQMSALGARADGVSDYQRSKYRGEEEVRNSGIPFTILRPSIIFGPRDGFVSQMVDVMRKAPVQPVVGHGRYPFRPIYIDNVVDCFVQSLTSEKAVGRSVDLGGLDELTLEQMLDEIARCIGVRKMKLHVPFALMKLNAAILGAVLRRPPVTTDQLAMLREGSTCDIGPMLETFDLKLVGFSEGLRKYLCPA
ncbi:MAG: complex I NDUFA9 subunit family protein [Terriglobales bacterium]